MARPNNQGNQDEGVRAGAEETRDYETGAVTDALTADDITEIVSSWNQEVNRIMKPKMRKVTNRAPRRWRIS